MSDAPQTPAEHAPVLEATEARQGRRGKPVLWVLIISTALVVLALFGAWFARSGDLARVEPNNAGQTTDAAAFNAPEPAARQAAEPGSSGESPAAN